MILSVNLLIIINWLKVIGKTPSKHNYRVSCLGNFPSQSFRNSDILLYCTNFARTANSIPLLCKSKFPVNMFQITVAIVHVFKIF